MKLEKEIENDKRTIQNLKFYNIKEKKYGFQKIGKVGITLALAAALAFGTVGCTVKSETNNHTTHNVAITQDVQYNRVTSNISGKYQSSFAENVGHTDISYGAGAYNDFNNYIDSIVVDYLNDEMFNYEEAHDYYANHPQNLSITHSQGGIIVNGRIDEEALLAVVKANSPVFKREANHYMYQDITSDEEYRIIIHFVAESLNDDLPYKTPEELAELDCILADLKIYYGTGVTSAKVTTERALLVNPAMIDAVRISERIDDAYQNIMYHEAKHLEQISCQDLDHEEHYQQGISRTNPNLEIDPYTWTWTAEGAAELGSIKLSQDKPTTYNYLVGYMETLDLISLPTEYNPDGRGVERASMNQEIDTFYNQMGIDRGLTEEEIVKMMFSMEIVQSRVPNYAEIYEKCYGIPFDESTMTTVREQHRSQFLIETTKIFYNNLAERIANENDLTLEDIMCLMTIYEGDLNFHLKYNVGSNLDKEHIAEVLRVYTEIQTRFLESIAMSNSMSYEEIMERYNNYQLFVLDGDTLILNADLNWLNPEQRAWLVQKATGDRITYTKPVNLVVEENLGKTKSN